MAQRGKRKIAPVDYFPAKPRGDGRYQKKINGRLYYFGGPNVSRDDAMAEYQRCRHQLYAGIAPPVVERADYTAWTLKAFGNKYLDARRAEVVAGTLRKVTYFDVHSSLVQFIRHVGGRRQVAELGPELFTGAATTLKGSISGCRWNHVVSAVNAWLNYAVAHQWLAALPAFGPRWTKIPLSQLPRRDRMVTPDEFQRLLKAANDQMRAMLYLSINAGMGPTDLATLRLDHIDGDVIRCQRTKTKAPRCAPLWPETVEAIEDWMTRRISDIPELFVTKYGRAWDGPDVVHEFTDLKKAAGFDMKERWGLNAFRHTFSTIADDFGDTNAKRLVMGHKFAGMDAVYVSGKRLERLREVVEIVRAAMLVQSPITSG